MKVFHKLLLYLMHFTNAIVLVAVELVTTTLKQDGVDVDSVVIVVVNLGQMRW